MQRALSRLSSEIFDVLIVGGGATGAFTARDAALRGLSVALIEARDFAAATSAHNSKLAHGGLRYLRNLEFKLVRESLRERRNLQAIAPHLLRPLPFLLPLTRSGERLKLATGLALYDLLSFDRNRLDDPAQQMPGHRRLGRVAALAREPVLEAPGFAGAFEYHDAQMYSPERIVLECLIDADAHGAAIANHVAAKSLLLRSGKIEGCIVDDRMTGARFDIRARSVVLAAGPWADLFLEQATGRAAAHKLIRSKGIHLLVPEISRSALTIEAQEISESGGHFFVLPWRGHTLLGTTDTAFSGDPERLGVSEADIQGFLATINRHLPAARQSRDRIEFFYAGLRPLVADGSKNSYTVSRRSELVDHAGEGLDGLFSALGGKWTTSRALAERITDALVKKLGRKAPSCATATTALPGGRFDRFEPMVTGLEKTWPGIASIRHLAHMFGARLPAVLKGAKVSQLAPLGPSGDTLVQISHAVQDEMALTLEDTVMRRTALGQFGRPDASVLEAAASIMAAALGWTQTQKQQQIANLDPLYRTIP
ncbi:MAG TPA: glycerol-3-phosphate dehydrogenase/oxidase [Rhizomicrobium sp.]|nr:glycerol-3-phosphate dehydrogenase/oxidase [Rhizomicrobium sp.]